MKYSYKGLNIIKGELDKIDFVSKCRLNDKDYIRKRKLINEN